MNEAWKPEERWANTERVGTHTVIRARYIRGWSNSVRAVLITLTKDERTGHWVCQIAGTPGETKLATTNLEEAKAAAIAIWRMG